MTHEQYLSNSRILWDRQDECCPVCGVEMDPGERMELAHRVPDTKNNRGKYGSAVLDHPDNLALVCTRNGVDGKACNSAVLRGAARPVYRDELMARIAEKLQEDTHE